MKNNQDIKQCVTVSTPHKPFVLYNDGVYFRDENGWGMDIKGKDTESKLCIVTCLNLAYKQGFEDACSQLMK